jgi:uncharacterized Tic20 family protein
MPEETTQHGTALEEPVTTEEQVPETFGAEVRPEEEVVAEEALTSEEKFLASLCHFCILAVAPIVIAPLIVWLTQKDKPGKSGYVLHHAKQAVLYQVLLAGAIVVLLSTIVLAPLAFILALAGMVYGVIGGITVCLGKKFNYVWFGEYVRRW